MRAASLTLIIASLLAGSAGAKRAPAWPCLVELDLDADGVVDERKRFSYEGPKSCHTPPDLDLIGCPTLEEELDRAGQVTRTRHFTYAASFDLTAVEYRRSDRATTRLTVRWGKAHELLKLEVDGGLDGKIDVANTYQRKGRTVIRDSRMRGPRGPLTLRASYHLDGEGRILRTETDHGANGSIEVRTVRKYKAGRPVSEELLGKGGKVIGRTRYVYSCP